MSGGPAIANPEAPGVMAADRAVIWVVLDRTGSMGAYATACANVFAEITPVLHIFGQGRVSVRVLAYGDYDTPDTVVEVSGPDAAALEFLDGLRVRGGGDGPEALKTAFTRLLSEISDDSASEASGQPGGAAAAGKVHNLAWLFTDAPPHASVPRGSWQTHLDAEQMLLGEGFDWLRVRAALAAAGVSVTTFLSERHLPALAAWYAALGPLVRIKTTAPEDISATVMDVFLHLIGEAPSRELTLLTAQLPYANMASEAEVPSRTRTDPLPASALISPFLRSALSGQLATLPKRLKADVDLRQRVCAQLAPLLVPKRVRGLKVNPMLAQIWRAVCAARRHDDRVQALCDSFSVAVAGPGFEDMREWVLESYNSQAEIDELLEACVAQERFVMALPTAFEVPSLKETLDVLRGTFTGDVAGGVTEALRSVTVVALDEPRPSAGQATTADADGAASSAAPTGEDGIPVDVTNSTLFAVLFHLMHPGTLASRRAAAITAALALVSQSAALRERAEAYLTSIAGQWTGADDWDTYPEVFAVSFMLLARKVRHVLTQQEAAFFDRVWYVWRVQRTRRVTVAVTTCRPMSAKPEVLPDHRVVCSACGDSRPVSLVVEGMCVWCRDTAHCANGGGTPSLTPAPVPACAANGESHLVRCRIKTCGAVYAVERPDQLNVQAKCHSCRNEEAAPVLVCRTCGGKVLVHDQAGVDAAAWECGVCAAGQDNTVTAQVPIEELVAENPELMGALELDVPLSALNKKLAAVFRSHDSEIVAQVGVTPAALTHNGLTVLNTVAATAELVHAVRHAETTDLCPVCCNTRALNAMTSACGRCETEVCTDCCRRWYALTPGQCPVNEAQLACMFCRRAPLRLADYCPKRHLPRSVQRPKGQLLGFCRMCRVIQGAMPRECAQGPVAVVGDWRCEVCVVSAGAGDLAGVMECPGCGFSTEKAGGCDHIECIVCKTHWCYVCGGEYNEDEIYDHMIDEHGSIGM